MAKLKELDMFVGIVNLKIYIPYSHSLKAKRSEVKSICAKVKNKFNVSIAEVEDQDIHQTIGIGFAHVSNNKKYIDSNIDKILGYIESITEGEITKIDREII